MQGKLFGRGADHKGRLNAWRFWINVHAAKPNVESSFLRGYVRDRPIEVLFFGITQLSQHHVDSLSAIERKENFRFAHCEIHIWVVRDPLNPHHLTRGENLSGFW